MPGLTLEASVLLHAHKRMRAHTLVLYTLAEEEGLVHWHTVQFEPESWEADSLPPVASKGPLFIRWYASVYREEDGMWAQEMVGAGSNHHSSHSVKLEDILLNEVGTVTLQGIAFPPFNDADRHPPNDEAQQLIRDVEKAMSALPTRCRVENDSFPDVAIHLDRVTALPSLWFALDSTRMKFDVANATRYFESAWRLVSAKSKEENPPLEQTLTDLIALPSLGWIYRGDATQSEEACDAWSSLWTYPGPDPLAFDCEDGAKALTELFLVFRRLPNFKNPALLALQTLARSYVPWFAIGELYSQDGGSAKSRSGVGLSGDYLMHCYVILLSTKGGSSITLESTAYASGVWDAARNQRALKREKMAHRREQEWVGALPSAQDRENARVRCPMSMVASQRMYGKLVALYSCCSGERAQFKLMGGIDTTTFLLDPSAHEPVSTPIDLPLGEVKRIFRRELLLSPPSSFPLAPADRQGDVDMSGVLFPLQDESAGKRTVAVTRTSFLEIRS